MAEPSSALVKTLRQNMAFAIAIAMLASLYLVYNFMHPRGFSAAVLIQNSNESVAIIFLAMAQTVPVLLGGLDLSVGAIMTLANCVASVVVNGSPQQIVLGMIITLATGTAFGFMNGLIVVYGRLQPIIATLATGAIAIGLALFIRPVPGGNVDGDISWALTNDLYEFVATYGLFDADAAWFQPIAWIPVPLLIVVVIAFGVWLPFKRTVTGRTVYAIGSAEGGRRSRPLPWPVSLPPAAGSISPSRHRRAMPTSPRPAPIRSIRLQPWWLAAHRCLAVLAGPSARWSAR